MNIQERELDSLKGAEYNPRKALKPGDPDFERIAASIEKFGYVDPIIINADGTIIGGHQRAQVLKSLGYSKAACVVVNFDKTKEKALNIALNKISGQWDGEKLKGLLVDLSSLGGLDNSASIGFSEIELKKTIGRVDLSGMANATQQATKGASLHVEDIPSTSSTAENSDEIKGAPTQTVTPVPPPIG